MERLTNLFVKEYFQMDLEFSNLDDLVSYAATYAFGTVLVHPEYYQTGQGKCYFAIAVNLGHTDSKVFDSVWRRECDFCKNLDQYPDFKKDGDKVRDFLEVANPGSKFTYFGVGHYVGDDHMAHCCKCNGTGYIEPYDLMITFVRRKDKLWNVSLYSTKPEIDCGEIAKSFGGGGHKGAAGFQVKELPFEI